jgi:outer membrane protein TolC
MGCVSSSTASDVSAVHSLAHERASLDVVARDPDRWERGDDDVKRLLMQPFTVDNAVRIALLNNRDLRAELVGLGVARGELVQASLFPNPEIEAQVRFPQKSSEGLRWDLGVGVDITRMILIGKRRGVAEAELDAARYRVAGATLDLGYQVRLAYYDVQAAQQQLELLRTALAALRASYDTAQALHAAGNLTDLDVSNEESAYEGMRVAVAETEADLIDRRERLNVLLGLFGHETTWQIETRLAEPTAEFGELDRLESRAIDASIELAETRSSLTAAARRVGLTESAGWLPDLSVGVHADREGDVWAVGPALTGTLPLFDQQQGNVLSRRSEFESMRERYVADAVMVRASVRSARARALSAEARVRQYRETVLPVRERVMKQSVLQYNAMQIGVFQLLQARREQIEAGRAYVQTLRDYWRARAALDQLMAGRLAGTFTMGEEPQRAAIDRSAPNER